MADGRFWCWDIVRRQLVCQPLTGLDKRHESHKERRINLGIKGPLDYSASPVFDGICVNFLLGGQFCRVSTLENRLVGTPMEDSAFLQTQRAAPLYVSMPNPRNKCRPFRLIVIPLRHYVLVVDIGIRGEERFSLLEWGNEDGQDEMRSPVLHDQWVYLATRNGNIFRLHMCGGLDEIQTGKGLEKMNPLSNHYLMAPMIVAKHLVMQTVCKTPVPTDKASQEAWHKAAITCIPIDENGDLMGDVHETEMKSFTRISQIKDSEHLANLSDGRSVYAKANANGAIFRVAPGKDSALVSINWNERDGVIPDISCHNALFIGNRIYAVDSSRSRLLSWDMKREKYLGIVDSLGESRNLFSQPVGYANIIALLFKESIHFVNLND